MGEEICMRGFGWGFCRGKGGKELGALRTAGDSAAQSRASREVLEVRGWSTLSNAAKPQGVSLSTNNDSRTSHIPAHIQGNIMINL